MQIEIQGESIELSQALKRADLVQSGGEAKHVIQSGQVLLNGEVETRRGRKLHPGDRIVFLDQEVLIQSVSPQANH